MKKTTKIFTALFLAMNVMPVFGAGSGPDGQSPENFSESTSTTTSSNPAPKGAKTTIMNDEISTQTDTEAKGKENGTAEKSGINTKNDSVTTKTQTPKTNNTQQTTNQTVAETKKESDPGEIEKKQKAFDDALANEQSMANRTLTAATTAATGLGAMEALQGLAEQKSDKAADADMNAYISTMRCKYGNTSVKMGADEIELPGGNDENMMKYRTEYIALAADLKERKSALNMAPGIESIEVLDKSTIGLYDDESVGITSGNYSSLYRAKALGSESDQAQIDEAAKTSKTRVIAGAAAAGVGVVGGTVGNFIINNQETKQRIEEAKAKRNARQLQNTALNKLKSCLAEAGVTGTNSLEFKNLIPTMFTLDNIDCKTDLTNLKGKKAQDLFADTTDENVLCDKLIKSFGLQLANKLAGCDDILENSDDDN